MATEQAFVRIRLAGASGASSVVRLSEDDEHNAGYESSFDSDKMMDQANSKSVLLYGLVGTHFCEDVVTNNLDGQALGMKTNQVDQNYTLTFDLVSGRALILYDRLTGTFTLMTNGASYAFSVDASLVGRKAINDRFIINYTLVPALCFRNNILEIIDHAGESLVITKDDAEIENVPSLGGIYIKDLSSYTGRLVVTLNGTDYQIDANPAVTPVTVVP